MTSYSYNYALSLAEMGKALENAGKLIQKGTITEQLNVPGIVDAMMRGYDSRERKTQFSVGDYQLDLMGKITAGTECFGWSDMELASFSVFPDDELADDIEIEASPSERPDTKD